MMFVRPVVQRVGQHALLVAVLVNVMDAGELAIAHGVMGRAYLNAVFVWELEEPRIP